MIYDIKDEILSGDPRYTIQDNEGKAINDNVQITLKTPLLEEGTPLNAALLKNFQGDLYTQDRYLNPPLIKTTVEVNYKTDLMLSEENHTGNCIPSNDSDWIADDDTRMAYTSTDGIKLSTTSTPKSTADAIKGLFTGAGYMTNSGSNYRTYIYATVDFGRYIKIKKLKYIINTNDDAYLAVYGINEDGTETAVYPLTKCVDNTDTEIVVSAQGYYKAYKFQIYDTGDTNYVQARKIEVTSYSDNPVFAITENVFEINLPLTSYENDKIVRLKSTADIQNPYLNINNLGTKQIFGTLKKNAYYTLIFVGNRWKTKRDLFDDELTPIIITESGTYEVDNTMTYKVVAVGGGGGSAGAHYNSTYAGGGGAGGYVEGILKPSFDTIEVTIGLGGNNGLETAYDEEARGEDGGDTLIGTFTAYGGKGGTANTISPTSNGKGGSYSGYFGKDGADGTSTNGSSATANSEDGNGWDVEGQRFGSGGYLKYSSGWKYNIKATDGVVVLYPMI